MLTGVEIRRPREQQKAQLTEDNRKNTKPYDGGKIQEGSKRLIKTKALSLANSLIRARTEIAGAEPKAKRGFTKNVGKNLHASETRHLRICAHISKLQSE